jgi:perosamine synthetase
MSIKVPITKSVFDATDAESIAKPLETGWVVQGPKVLEFEKMFAEFSGVKHAIATTSCTTAMHICVAALDLKPGDEVLVPALTWVATANAVEYLGAKPVFCDIDLDTFNISTSEIEKKTTSRTKAIMPVHLFGLSANMDWINSWAKEKGLYVIEDAACGFGARYRGKHVGGFGEFGCFSFHPRKAITTGEGGMITTNDDQLASLCRTLRDHGASRSDHTRHNAKQAFLLAEYNHLGYNFRMTDIQGALGVSQMNKANWIQEQRVARAKNYDQQLQNIDWLNLPIVPKECDHAYQSYVCLYAPEKPSLSNCLKLNEKRNKLMSNLEDLGIATRQGTHAAALLGYYVNKYGNKLEEYPNAYLAEMLTITLPLYAQMTDVEQSHVVENLTCVE